MREKLYVNTIFMVFFQIKINNLIENNEKNENYYQIDRIIEIKKPVKY